MSDPHWRVANLYTIKDEHGHVVAFRPNSAQAAFLRDMWYLNLVLKARQRGITTLIDLILLDIALFTPNTKCAIIADSEDKAREIFREKIQFPYERLPAGFRQARYTEVETGQKIEFNNGSSILVGTSVRGLTFQYLHISELGRIARKYPEKAHEIRTGALNTVHAGNYIFIESTAEGREGLFYELCTDALARSRERAPLTKLSFKLHFYPWWDERYRLAPDEAAHVRIVEADHKYFDTLEQLFGVTLDLGARAWYVEKRRTQGEDMKREFPSTPEESFEVSTEGKIFATQMVRVRTEGRIRTVPWIPAVPVNTYWDLGHGDYTAIWFHQHHLIEHRFIRYYQACGEDLSHYIVEARRHGYVFGKFYLPHDAENHSLNDRKTAVDRLIELGVPKADIVVLKRPQNKWTDSINVARAVLPMCWFDATGCLEGIDALDNYAKEWNERMGMWRDEPAGNKAAHGADAFQVFARGWAPAARTKPAPRVTHEVLDPETGY